MYKLLSKKLKLIWGEKTKWMRIYREHSKANKKGKIVVYSGVWLKSLFIITSKRQETYLSMVTNQNCLSLCWQSNKPNRKQMEMNVECIFMYITQWATKIVNKMISRSDQRYENIENIDKCSILNQNKRYICSWSELIVDNLLYFKNREKSE